MSLVIGQGLRRASDELDPNLVIRQSFLEASLALARKVGPAFAFTRASEGRHFESDGVYRSEAIDVPLLASHRYNGSIWVNDGLLWGPARTNLILQAEDLETTWTTLYGTPTVDSLTTAPDGNNTAMVATDNDAGGFEIFAQSITVAASADPHILSAFVKKTTSAASFPGIAIVYKNGAGTNRGDATLDTDTGALVERTGVSSAIEDSGVEDHEDYWRFWMLVTNNGTHTTIEIDWATAVQTSASGAWAASATGSSTVWGFMVEEADTLSSYIPTVAAQVTRAAPALGTTDMSWYSDSVGFTALIKGVRPKRAAVAGEERLFIADDGTANNRIMLSQDASDNLVGVVTDGGAGQASESVAGFTSNAEHNVAFRATPNDFKACMDGTLSSGDTSGTLPSGLTALEVLYSSVGSLQSHMSMRELLVHRGGKSDAWLQASTT